MKRFFLFTIILGYSCILSLAATPLHRQTNTASSKTRQDSLCEIQHLYQLAKQWRQEGLPQCGLQAGELASQLIGYIAYRQLPVEEQINFLFLADSICQFCIELQSGKVSYPDLFPNEFLTSLQRTPYILEIYQLLMSATSLSEEQQQAYKKKYHESHMDILYRQGYMNIQQNKDQDALGFLQKVIHSLCSPQLKETAQTQITSLQLVEKSIQYTPQQADSLLQIHLSPTISPEQLFTLSRLPDYYLMLTKIAWRYETIQQIPKTIICYQLFIRQITRQLQATLPWMITEDRQRIWQCVKPYIKCIQQFAFRHLKKEGIAELLYNSHILKQNLLAVTHPDLPILLKASSLQEVQTLQHKIDSLYTLPALYLLPQSADYLQKIKLEAQITHLRRKQVHLLQNDRMQTASLSLSSDWKDIQALLLPHEGVIETIEIPMDFFGGELVAVTFTKESKHPTCIPLFHTQEWVSIVIQDKSDKMIWEKIAPFVSQCTELYIGLDGGFLNFPFSTLKENGQYLFQKYQLHHLFTTRDICFLKQPHRQRVTPSLFFFGDASFTLPPSHTPALLRGQGFAYLAGSKAEIDSIQTLLPPTWKHQTFLGKEANKYNFQQLSYRIPPQSILHIATHGFQLTHNPDIPDNRISRHGESAYEDPMMRSGFALSGANTYWEKPKPYDGSNNGIITSLEISRMNLSDAKLVITSACQTAEGTDDKNEGLYGVTRAFRMAGAQAILAFRMNISDQDAVTYICTFYTHLIKEPNLSKAFRNTQLELLARFPHQSYLWNKLVLLE